MKSCVRTKTFRPTTLLATIGLLMAFGALLVGCSGEEPSIGAAGDDSGSSQLTSKTPTQDNQEQVNYEIRFGRSYSEDRAWVYYSTTGENHANQWGCIDKTGTVLFSIPARTFNINPTPFENGVSYLVPSTGSDSEGHFPTIGIVDKQGNLSSLGGEEGEEIAAYGGGFVVLERHEESFDSNSYTYEIYNQECELVRTISAEEQAETCTVAYCGQGVFGFQMYTNGGNPTLFWCSGSDKVVEIEADRIPAFRLGEEWALISSAPDSQLTFLSSSGDIIQRQLPVEVSPFLDGTVSEGIYSVYSEGYYITYNINTDETYVLSDDYAIRADGDYYQGNDPIFHEGLCVLGVVGDDGEDYVQIFDTSWNLVAGPIRATANAWDNAIYSEGVVPLVLKDHSTSKCITSVYDETGEELYQIDGFMSAVSNGVMLLSESECSGYDPFTDTYYFLDTISFHNPDGSTLFDTFDASNSKELHINWTNE